MSRTPKVDRARRNALKAASFVFGVILATGAPHKRALAQVSSTSTVRPTPVPVRGSCFARGTQIRTGEGYLPVDTLAVGDEVAVRFGGFAPIKTMVSHTLNCVSGKWNGDPNNLPVLIRRGALGENSPAADLCLTAWHAVYVDGFLMRASDLVNGTSIIFGAADGQDTLDFFNIELDRHDILDVQGAFCESLYRAGTERCAPLGFTGGRSRLRSRLRSVASLVVDRRQPIDIIRDNLEERGLDFARVA
jgi:hypothetical protein